MKPLLVVTLLAAGACSSNAQDKPAPELLGTYKGTATIAYAGRSATFGVTMTFKADGSLISHSDMDEPQHGRFELTPDRKQIKLLSRDGVLNGHIEITELTATTLKGRLIPSKNVKDLGTTNTFELRRVIE